MPLSYSLLLNGEGDYFAGVSNPAPCEHLGPSWTKRVALGLPHVYSGDRHSAASSVDSCIPLWRMWWSPLPTVLAPIFVAFRLKFLQSTFQHVDNVFNSQDATFAYRAHLVPVSRPPASARPHAVVSFDLSSPPTDTPMGSGKGSLAYITVRHPCSTLELTSQNACLRVRKFNPGRAQKQISNGVCLRLLSAAMPTEMFYGTSSFCHGAYRGC